MKYDTRWLTAQVKRIESIPANQATFTEEDFVALMNMELQSVIIPLIQRVNEEYFVFTEDIPITTTTRYVDIPGEATGLRLRDVYWVNPDGSISKISRLNPEQVASWSYAFGGYYGLSGFYIQNNQLILYPMNTNSGTIRLTYFRRPNDLVSPSQTGVIIAINTISNEVTLDNAPDTSVWTTGTKLDGIKGETPFDFAAQNFAIVSRSGFVLELPADVIAKLSVGDIIATRGESSVPQLIPVEAYHLLVQATGMRCLESLGDRQGWANAAAKYNTMQEDLLAMINPRIPGEIKKAVGTGGILGSSRINSYTSYWVQAATWLGGAAILLAQIGDSLHTLPFV